MKRHPYIVATVIATLLAIVVWLLTPKEYTAITKLSDEYKEVDLAIGLDRLKAQFKNVSGVANKGINDIGAYAKILKSEDFARDISHSRVPSKDMMYGEYLNKKDTIDAILDNINYNLSIKHQTLTISFTDRDPVVAAQMLDSVTARLQAIVTDHRHQIAEAELKNATEELERAKKSYQELCHRYDAFVDSHKDLLSESEIQEEKALQNECEISYNHLKEITTEYTRHLALKQRAYMSFAVIHPTTVPSESNERLEEYLLFFLVIALLFTYGIIKFKRNSSHKKKLDYGGLTSPWTITIGIWSIMLILLQFRDPTILNAPKEQFYISLLLWLFFFCVTSVIAYNLTADNKKNCEQTRRDGIEPTNINMFVFHILLFLSIIMTPLYVKRIYDVVLMFGTDDFMNNVRLFAVTGDLNVGILSFSVPINISLLLVSLWGYPKVKMWQVMWACTACLLNSLAIMEKGEILTVFFCILFVLYERGKIRIRSISVFVVIIVLFFFIFNLMRAEEGSTYKEEGTLIDFIAMYVLSPPVAFGELSQDIVHQFAARTVPTIYYLLNKYYADVFIVYDRVQPFVYVPVPTNVYTIFQPFFQDFGYIGVASAGVVYGLMGGVLYRRACNGNPFSKCLYTYFAYILLLQFFQENLFTLGLFIPELMLFTYICTQKTFILSTQSNDNAKKNIT